MKKVKHSETWVLAWPLKSSVIWVTRWLLLSMQFHIYKMKIIVIHKVDFRIKSDKIAQILKFSIQ